MKSKTKDIVTSNLKNKKEDKKFIFSKGDILTAELQVKIGDKVIDEFTTQEIFTLGWEGYLPGFDKLLINKKIETPIHLKYKFLKSYEDVELKGKEADVTLKLVNLVREDKTFIFIEPQKEDVAKEPKKHHHHETSKEKELEAEIDRLKRQLEVKDIELKYTINSIQEKAKSLQEKANEEIKKALSENTEKIERDKQEIRQYALQNFLEDFITPYNNFELAIESGKNIDNQMVKNFVIGFNMIQKQFERMLEDNKIEIIKPEIGQMFDPEINNVMDIQYDKHKPINSILKVNMNGFKLSGRVVSPAQVTINKKN
ncbi:nucleotide exchange factor GrpE [Mycoplasma crocodyli]|uniref:Protein GrpE n=1 Tax=Mycoplasma crocodyli (strain ATCC 51981 / MP145) TaxID=512564 RepID=D5E5Z9_MYCCM|nr:nucleotide exchange factor GrpE [Mycoplasma crocodyli]ADE19448.1 chaperone protein GrpE [Mycoplasma crocodyli MP145]